MRITGGKYRGRNVKCPKGIIRPAMDRMRESLFSILGNIDGCSWLDLFSGSGIIGMEAASRGAEPVVLVEMDRIKKPVIQKNLSWIESNICLQMRSVQSYIKQCKKTFDYIFLDPPFPLDNKIRFIELVDSSRILEKDGCLMIHHPSENEFPEQIANLRQNNMRSYGRSILRFYCHE